ncbi:hypothetical protein FACS189449_12690 [Alphaproteobacteria bacterium]|nr:hypothetical protein FACS189449_12690 [Alphaproteobacteria bacterium]
MNILALDLGTKCGFAIWKDGSIISGTKKLQHNKNAFGLRFLDFRRWLIRMIGEHNVYMLFFERVHGHKGTDAAHCFGGFMYTLASVCEEFNIKCTGIPVGTIKKFATGKGNARVHTDWEKLCYKYRDPSSDVAKDRMLRSSFPVFIKMLNKLTNAGLELEQLTNCDNKQAVEFLRQIAEKSTIRNDVGFLFNAVEDDEDAIKCTVTKRDNDQEKFTFIISVAPGHSKLAGDSAIADNAKEYCQQLDAQTEIDNFLGAYFNFNPSFFFKIIKAPQTFTAQLATMAYTGGGMISSPSNFLVSTIKSIGTQATIDSRYKECIKFLIEKFSGKFVLPSYNLSFVDFFDGYDKIQNVDSGLAVKIRVELGEDRFDSALKSSAPSMLRREVELIGKQAGITPASIDRIRSLIEKFTGSLKMGASDVFGQDFLNGYIEIGKAYPVLGDGIRRQLGGDRFDSAITKIASYVLMSNIAYTEPKSIELILPPREFLQ